MYLGLMLLGYPARLLFLLSCRDTTSTLEEVPQSTVLALWPQTSSLQNGRNRFLLFVNYPGCGGVIAA